MSFFSPPAPSVFQRSEYAYIANHRVDPSGSVDLLLQWHSFPPTWVPRSRVAQRDAEAYFIGVANAALTRL